MLSWKTGISALLAMSLLLLAPFEAQATGVIADGQFAASVERGQPVGDTAAMAAGTRVFYFIRLENPHGDEVTFTVTWSVNGVARNPMTIRSRGRSTWVFQPVRANTRQLSVVIRDASGTQLHTDQVTLRN